MENQCAYLLTLQRVFGHPLTSCIVQAHTNSHLVLIILLTISSCFYKNMRYLQVSTNYPTVYFPPLAPGRPCGLCAGEFVVPDDFDAPLPEDLLHAFEGACDASSIRTCSSGSSAE